MRPGRWPTGTGPFQLRVAEAQYWANAKIQLCIVRMVRNSLKFVPWKDYKKLTADLKRIYQSMTEQEASMELDRFADKWDDKYPLVHTGTGHCCDNIYGLR